MKRVLLPLVAGALGYFAERVHRAAGVWVLDGDMPLWIALVYALGIAALDAGFRRFDHLAGGRRAAIEALPLMMLFLAPPLLYRQEILLAAISAAYLAARLLLTRAPGDVVVVIAVAAADLVLEGALVAAGLFRYSVAAFAPLPLWLPLLWGGMALSLRRLFALARRF